MFLTILTSLITSCLQCVQQNFILFAFLSSPLIYRYLNQGLDFWSKRNVKGPKPVPIFGNSIEPLYRAGHLIQQERYTKYGKVFGYFEKSTPFLSIADPTLLKSIMVKDYNSFINRKTNSLYDEITSNFITSFRDDKWKSTRTIITPSFTSSKIRRMFSLLNDCCDNALKRIEKHAKNNDDVDLINLFGAFTMDVIARCAFATKTDAHTNPKDPFINNAYNFFRLSMWRLLVVMLFPAKLLNFIGFSITPSSITDFFRNIVKSLMIQRKQTNAKHNDFFQLLTDARKAVSIVDEMKDINDGHFQNESLEDMEINARSLNEMNTKNSATITTSNGELTNQLTETEIIAQCMLFFIVGYDTVGSLLIHTGHALALYEKVQEKLYEEIKACKEKYGEITYESLNEMVYLNAVINEALRLYTPVIKTEREASYDYEFQDIGLKIPKGQQIAIPLYAIHHDPENFEDPDEFRPERFLPENLDKIKPFTYLPFGTGPRNCIGLRLALIEAKVVIARMVYEYRFVRSDQTDEPIVYDQIGVLAISRVKRSICKFEKRVK